jgi:hypothetical protein
MTSHSPSGVRHEDRSEQYRPWPLSARAGAPASPALLRQMLTTFMNTLRSAEADAVCGAEYGSRFAEQTNVRNGYRPREFDTRAGIFELAAPKLRSGSYFPDWLLERRRRAERALTTVVATCYLPGGLDPADRGAGEEPGHHPAGKSRTQRDDRRPRRAGRGLSAHAARRRSLHVSGGRRPRLASPGGRPGGQRARSGRDRG